MTACTKTRLFGSSEARAGVVRWPHPGRRMSRLQEAAENQTDRHHFQALGPLGA